MTIQCSLGRFLLLSLVLLALMCQTPFAYGQPSGLPQQTSDLGVFIEDLKSLLDDGAPRLSVDQAHYVLIFDMSFPRTIAPDAAAMRRLYTAILRTIPKAGDHITLAFWPYGREEQYREFLYLDVPSNWNERMELTNKFHEEVLLGTWSWFWAAVPVIDLINANRWTDEPTVILHFSNSSVLVGHEGLGYPPNYREIVSEFEGMEIQPAFADWHWAYERIDTLPDGRVVRDPQKLYMSYLFNQAAKQPVSAGSTPSEARRPAVEIQGGVMISPSIVQAKLGESITFQAELVGGLQQIENAFIYQWQHDGELKREVDLTGKSVQLRFANPGDCRVWVEALDTAHPEDPAYTDEVTITIVPPEPTALQTWLLKNYPWILPIFILIMILGILNLIVDVLPLLPARKVLEVATNRSSGEHNQTIKVRARGPGVIIAGGAYNATTGEQLRVIRLREGVFETNQDKLAVIKRAPFPSPSVFLEPVQGYITLRNAEGVDIKSVNLISSGDYVSKSPRITVIGFAHKNPNRMDIPRSEAVKFSCSIKNIKDT